MSMGMERGGGGVRAGGRRLGQRIWANVGGDGGIEAGRRCGAQQRKDLGGGWPRHVLSVAILAYRSLTGLVCPEPPGSPRHTGLVKAHQARQPCRVFGKS